MGSCSVRLGEMTKKHSSGNVTMSMFNVKSTIIITSEDQDKHHFPIANKTETGPLNRPLPAEVTVHYN